VSLNKRMELTPTRGKRMIGGGFNRRFNCLAGEGAFMKQAPKWARPNNRMHLMKSAPRRGSRRHSQLIRVFSCVGNRSYFPVQNSGRKSRL